MYKGQNGTKNAIEEHNIGRVRPRTMGYTTDTDKDNYKKLSYKNKTRRTAARQSNPPYC